ncbi:hypothetical protein [Saccharothrix sp. ST-888]|uniref:hypothetical protein n=1 Tax=Saccharothrix sp. ST-888 TaxID=1427391 RepID=UPI001E504F85|nr:hypothetical protein [Saccharothrix sp. ST-888]
MRSEPPLAVEEQLQQPLPGRRHVTCGRSQQADVFAEFEARLGVGVQSGVEPGLVGGQQGVVLGTGLGALP